MTPEPYAADLLRTLALVCAVVITWGALAAAFSVVITWPGLVHLLRASVAACIGVLTMALIYIAQLAYKLRR